MDAGPSPRPGCNPCVTQGILRCHPGHPSPARRRGGSFCSGGRVCQFPFGRVMGSRVSARPNPPGPPSLKRKGGDIRLGVVAWGRRQRHAYAGLASPLWDLNLLCPISSSDRATEAYSKPSGVPEVPGFRPCTGPDSPERREARLQLGTGPRPCTHAHAHHPWIVWPRPGNQIASTTNDRVTPRA